MITIACILSKTDRYSSDDVRELETLTASGSRARFVCLTNRSVEGSYIQPVAIQHNWAWPWTKMELFRGDQFVENELVLYCDLSLAKKPSVLSEIIKQTQDHPGVVLKVFGGKETYLDAVGFVSGYWNRIYDNLARNYSRITGQYTVSEWMNVCCGTKRIKEFELGHITSVE